MGVKKLWKRRVLASGVFAASLALAAPSGAVAAGVCASLGDDAALNARVLQTELMVAALSCGQQDQYNAFIHTFRPLLQKRSVALQNLFQRAHGASGNKRLNGFVTRLANESSQRSITIRNSYCGETATLFEQVMKVAQSEFDTFSAQPWVRLRHGYALCPGQGETATRTALGGGSIGAN